MKLSEIPEDTAPAPAGASSGQKLSQTGGDTQEQPSALGALFRGFLQGAGDPVYGGAQIGARTSPAMGMEGPMPDPRPPAMQQQQQQQVDTAAQRREQAYQTDPRLQGGMRGIAAGAGRFLGNAAATAPLALAAGGGASVPARIGMGMATGALGAVTQPVTGEGDFWTEKAKQLAVGGVVGGAVAGVGQAIPAALGATLPPQARGAIAAYPIVGRMVSGATARTPENFNAAAVNQALEPIGVTAPKNLKAGPGLVQFAKDKYDDAYNALLPKLSLAHDPQLGQELQALRKGATDMGDDELNQFQRNLTNRFGENDKRLQNGFDGRGIKEIESKLRQLAVTATTQNKPGLAQHLYEARDAFLGAVERQNPAEAAELKKINQGFALYARVETAAATAAKGGRHTFTPQELRNASFRSDKSARHGNFARAADLMQGVANAGDFALSRGQWTPGNVSRFTMPLIGAALGLEHGGGFGAAAGAGAGTALRSALPAAVTAARSAPVGPAARAVGKAVSGFAPAAAMKAARKVGELKSQVHAANRRGDLKELQSLNSQLAEAIADYRKLRPSA